MLAVFHFPTVCISRFARVALAFVLVLALCSGCVLQPASAVSAGVTVAVSGGAIGAGGIPALGAIGSLLTPTLGVIGAVLLGAGINAYVTDQSAAQGVTKTQFIESSLRNWVAERNISFDDVIGTIAEGIHVSPLGQIAISGAASLLIYQFGNWLFANDSVVESPSTSGTDNVSIGDFSMHTIVSGQSLEYVSGPHGLVNAIYWADLQVSPLYSIILNSGSRSHVLCYVYPDTYTISYNSFRIYDQNGRMLNVFGDGVATPYDLGNGYKIVPDIYWRNCDIPAIPTYDISLQQFVSAVTGLPLGSGISLPSDDVFTGNEQDWLDNRDLLKPGDDSSVVISNAPDLLGGLADGLAAGSYNISVPDYLTSIADAYNHALTAEAAIPVTLTNTDTGVLVTQTVEIANPFEGVANTTGAVGDHTGSGGDLLDPAADVNGPDTVALLKHDLKDFFPFCIPWDVYRLIMLFHGTPRAPVYRVSWDAPYLDEPITFGIDLSQWDSVAETWRLCYKIAFMMGLVLESRKVIKI